jgi:hypothetical protein
MKRLSLLLALAPLLALAAEPAPKSVDTLEDLRPLAAQAPVAAIDFTLPEEKPAKTLWDRFANKPEEKQFAVVTARDWKAKWKLLVEVLVAKAEQQKLNSAELRACLATLNMGCTEETAPEPMDAEPIGQMYTKDGKLIEGAPPAPPPAPEPLPESEGPGPKDGPITYSEPPDTGMEGTIPVGAYLARSATGPCWIIVCKWEMAHPDHPNAQLSHIRIWAVDCVTHKIIGFTGCD